MATLEERLLSKIVKRQLPGVIGVMLSLSSLRLDLPPTVE
jgi:hypothetical protein